MTEVFKNSYEYGGNVERFPIFNLKPVKTEFPPQETQENTPMKDNYLNVIPPTEYPGNSLDWRIQPFFSPTSTTNVIDDSIYEGLTPEVKLGPVIPKKPSFDSDAYNIVSTLVQDHGWQLGDFVRLKSLLESIESKHSALLHREKQYSQQVPLEIIPVLENQDLPVSPVSDLSQKYDLTSHLPQNKLNRVRHPEPYINSEHTGYHSALNNIPSNKDCSHKQYIDTDHEKGGCNSFAHHGPTEGPRLEFSGSNPKIFYLQKTKSFQTDDNKYVVERIQRYITELPELKKDCQHNVRKELTHPSSGSIDKSYFTETKPISIVSNLDTISQCDDYSNSRFKASNKIINDDRTQEPFFNSHNSEVSNSSHDEAPSKILCSPSNLKSIKQTPQSDRNKSKDQQTQYSNSTNKSERKTEVKEQTFKEFERYLLNRNIRVQYSPTSCEKYKTEGVQKEYFHKDEKFLSETEKTCQNVTTALNDSQTRSSKRVLERIERHATACEEKMVKPSKNSTSAPHQSSRKTVDEHVVEKRGRYCSTSEREDESSTLESSTSQKHCSETRVESILERTYHYTSTDDSPKEQPSESYSNSRTGTDSGKTYDDEFMSKQTEMYNPTSEGMIDEVGLANKNELDDNLQQSKDFTPFERHTFDPPVKFTTTAEENPSIERVDRNSLERKLSNELDVVIKTSTAVDEVKSTTNNNQINTETHIEMFTSVSTEPKTKQKGVSEILSLDSPNFEMSEPISTEPSLTTLDGLEYHKTSSVKEITYSSHSPESDLKRTLTYSSTDKSPNNEASSTNATDEDLSPITNIQNLSSEEVREPYQIKTQSVNKSYSEYKTSENKYNKTNKLRESLSKSEQRESLQMEPTKKASNTSTESKFNDETIKPSIRSTIAYGAEPLNSDTLQTNHHFRSKAESVSSSQTMKNTFYRQDSNDLSMNYNKPSSLPNVRLDTRDVRFKINMDSPLKGETLAQSKQLSDSINIQSKPESIKNSSSIHESDQSLENLWHLQKRKRSLKNLAMLLNNRNKQITPKNHSVYDGNRNSQYSQDNVGSRENILQTSSQPSEVIDNLWHFGKIQSSLGKINARRRNNEIRQFGGTLNGTDSGKRGPKSNVYINKTKELQQDNSNNEDQIKRTTNYSPRSSVNTQLDDQKNSENTNTDDGGCCIM